MELEVVKRGWEPTVQVWAPTDLDDDARNTFLVELVQHLSRSPDVEAHTPLARAIDLVAVAQFVSLTATSSSVLIAAIKTLPQFLHARRSDVTVTIGIGEDGEKAVTITAMNTKDAMELIESALEEQRGANDS